MNTQPHIQQFPTTDRKAKEEADRIKLAFMGIKTPPLVDPELFQLLAAPIGDVTMLRELKTAIDRSLNTWEDCPPWMYTLADRLDMHLTPEPVFMTQGQAADMKFARARFPMVASSSGDDTYVIKRDERVQLIKYQRSFLTPNRTLIHEYLCSPVGVPGVIFMERSTHLFDFTTL